MTDIIKKLQNQITEMQKQLDELKSQTGGWTPDVCGDYCFLDADGDISDFIWEDGLTEKKWLSQGNIFKTLAEAEKEKGRRAVIKKLRDLSGGHQFKVGEDNWRLQYDHKDDIWQKVIVYYCQGLNDVYFPTMEAAQHAIDVLGDELNKLL